MEIKLSVLDTEVVFRQHGVHSVAIDNGIDNNDPNSGEFTPFINIMSEWYLQDLSHKQRIAIRVKGESCKPTTNCAIHSYVKGPADKYHRLVQEEETVVRRIFQLTMEGKGPYDITLSSMTKRWRRLLSISRGRRTGHGKAKMTFRIPTTGVAL